MHLSPSLESAPSIEIPEKSLEIAHPATVRTDNASENPTAALTLDAEKYDEQGQRFAENIVFGDRSTDEAGHEIKYGFI